MTDESDRLSIAIETSRGIRQIAVVVLHPGRNTIGHGQDNDVPLDDPSLASPHVVIDVTPDGTVLTNLIERHDVVIENELVLANRPRLMNNDTTFTVGVYLLTYNAAASAPHPKEFGEPTPSIEKVEQTTTLHEEIIPPPLRFVPAPEVQHMLPLESHFSRYIVERAVSRYLSDLPAVYQGREHVFLGRYLKIFEAIWEPFESRQNAIAMYFDPRTCPASFLDWLEHWMGIGWSAHWPEERRRRLLAEISRLYKWRGTADILAEAIELYTGTRPIVSNLPEPFTIEIDPRLSKEHSCERPIVESLIRMFKPAHVNYRLKWSDNRG